MGGRIFRPRWAWLSLKSAEDDERRVPSEAATEYQPEEPHPVSLNRGASTRPRLFAVPTLFDEPDDEDEDDYTVPSPPQPVLLTQPMSRAQRIADSFLPMAGRIATFVGTTLHNLLPEHTQSLPAGRKQGRLPIAVPRRALIVAGMVALVAILALSVFSMTRNPKQSAVNQFLAEAQQEDLLANQPSTPASERQAHLNKVIELSNQALQVEPQSGEAARLLHKAQASMDAVQGVTRVEPKLLFDLDDADRAVGASGATGATGALSPTWKPGGNRRPE